MAEQKKSPAILTPVGRASFPVLAQPKANESGDLKYSMTLIFDKAAQQTPEFRALKDAAEKAIQAKWPGDSRPRKLKMPFLTVDDLDKIPDGYTDDCVFIRMSSNNRPQVVGRDPSVKIDATEVYPGMYVRASVRAYAWTHKTGGNGVSFGLGNVQIVKDGERFGGGTKAEDDFDALPEDDDDNPFA